jgi:hypothetical protein
LATSTKIIEFRPTSGIQTSFGSETSAASIELGQRKAPGTVTAVDTPIDEIVDSPPDKPLDRPSLRLSQAELYPVRAAFSIEHITALRLLGLAIGRTKRALDALSQSDDILAADIEIQKIQVLLPELFCCRELGDGFGTIVNAFMSAFEVLQGDTLSAAQLRMLAQVFQLLREQPFLGTDEADRQIEKLESVGLNPYPMELVEFLSSE